jgi:hypothetical protein
MQTLKKQYFQFEVSIGVLLEGTFKACEEDTSSAVQQVKRATLDIFYPAPLSKTRADLLQEYRPHTPSTSARMKSPHP